MINLVSNLLNKYIPVFVLVLSAILFAVFFLTFESILVNINPEFDLPTSIFLIITIFLALLAFKILDIANLLKSQRLYNQYSWIFYFYFGFSLAFFCTLIVFLYTRIWPPLNYIWPLKTAQPLAIIGNIDDLSNWGIRLLIYFVSILFYFSIKPKEIRSAEWQFAPGSAGLDKDELGYKNPAKNIAEGLKNEKDYVEVHVLYGDAGMGKSSFIRQIVESLTKTNLLYTYISLTETNAAKDFSSLFSERWILTIKERYPKLNSVSAMNVLRIITRETNQGFISEILYFISSLNIPFLPTLSKASDRYVNKRLYVSSAVAKIFGNVTEIKEDMWIIVIDEIERAKLDEVYRLTEVIERFKYEGRSGLPVRLVFFLCIARQDLFDNLNKQNNEHHPNELAQLIKKFIEDMKNMTEIIFLPPVSYQIKESFVISRLLEINQQFRIDNKLTVATLKPLSTYRLIDHTRFPDEKTTMHAIISMLIEESPRIINRVIEGIKGFYYRALDLKGKPLTKMIAYCDIITLTYISVKYPFIIDFYKKTIDELLPHEEPSFVNDRMVASFKKEKDDTPKRSLIDWVMKEVKITLDEELSIRIGRLITMSAFLYLKRYKYDYQDLDKLEYENRSSLPENLFAYLYLSEPPNTTFIRNNQIFHRHKEREVFIKSLSNEEMVNYSKFLRNYVSGKEIIPLRISWLNEVLTRFELSKIKPVPGHITGGTIGEGLTYEFIFQILWSLENVNNDSQNYSIIFNYLLNFLKSKQIILYYKYIILNSFINSDQKEGDIHFRLNREFSKIPLGLKANLIKITGNVMNEIFERYSNEISIYSKEENFLYVLYQSGLGKLDNGEPLRKIHKIGENGLNRHPNAIEIYWNQLPYKEGTQAVEEVWDFFHGSGVEFYISLDSLINITKQSKIYRKIDTNKISFWEKVSKTPEQKAVYLEKVNKHDATGWGTLFAVLKSKGYI